LFRRIQNSEEQLRKSEDEAALFADISYAQVEDAIEKKAMRLVQKLSMEPSSSSVVKPSDDVDFKNYAMSVINEARSYDRIYSKIMEREH